MNDISTLISFQVRQVPKSLILTMFSASRTLKSNTHKRKFRKTCTILTGASVIVTLNFSGSGEWSCVGGGTCSGRHQKCERHCIHRSIWCRKFWRRSNSMQMYPGINAHFRRNPHSRRRPPWHPIKTVMSFYSRERNKSFSFLYTSSIYLIGK